MGIFVFLRSKRGTLRIFDNLGKRALIKSLVWGHYKLNVNSGGGIHTFYLQTSNKLKSFLLILRFLARGAILSIWTIYFRILYGLQYF